MPKHLKIVKKAGTYFVCHTTTAQHLFAITPQGCIGADELSQQSFRDVMTTLSTKVKKVRAPKTSKTADVSTTSHHRATKKLTTTLCRSVIAVLSMNDAALAGTMSRKQIAAKLSSLDGTEVTLDGESFKLAAAPANKLPLAKLVKRGEVVTSGTRGGRRYVVAAASRPLIMKWEVECAVKAPAQLLDNTLKAIDALSQVDFTHITEEIIKDSSPSIGEDLPTS